MSKAKRPEDSTPKGGVDENPVQKATKTKKQKKDKTGLLVKQANFLMGFNDDILFRWDEEQFSDDDTEEIKVSKKLRILSVKRYLSDYSSQRGLENSRESFFYSWGNFCNMSMTTFGSGDDMESRHEDEFMRRVRIMINIIFEFFPEEFDFSFIDFGENPPEFFPMPHSNLKQIEEAGFKLSDWKKGMRRLIRKVICWGFLDNFENFTKKMSCDMARQGGQYKCRFEDVADPLFSDDDDFEPDKEIWAPLFLPYLETTCSSFEDVRLLESKSIHKNL